MNTSSEKYNIEIAELSGLFKIIRMSPKHFNLVFDPTKTEFGLYFYEK